jgi:hypothetical protein
MRYITHKIGADGWSEWIQPLPGYRLACCDCGLVHDMEFRANGDAVEFRVRRNERATAARRRHAKRREAAE